MPTEFSSRAGQKLDHALSEFKLDVTGLICADLGCSTGGFTSCLLARGATKVYAVDTGYGVLDWKLRNDPRVVVMERINALHVQLPELVDIITIDVGWTPQRLILPHAFSLLKPGGKIISLLKPHYEAKNAHMTSDQTESTKNTVVQDLKDKKINITNIIKSPITGEKAHNTEYLLLIEP